MTPAKRRPKTNVQPSHRAHGNERPSRTRSTALSPPVAATSSSRPPSSRPHEDQHACSPYGGRYGVSSSSDDSLHSWQIPPRLGSCNTVLAPAGDLRNGDKTVALGAQVIEDPGQGDRCPVDTPLRIK